MLTVLNGAGAWGNSLPDPMFRNYIYSGNGGNLTITLSGLPSGTCDVYVYGHSVTTNDNAIIEVWSDDANWGTKGTSLIGPGPTYAAWELGQQYVLFKDVAITAGKPLVLHSKHNTYGYNNVCGLQLAYKGPVDADADGLPDGWEMRYFENLDATASGDADADGLSNLREYQIGTEPARSDSNANGISDLNDLERLWLEDATPRGAYPGGAGESFTWVSSWWDGSDWGGSTLLPHSGRWWDASLPALMHVSALVPNAMHQHYFHSSVPTLRPVAGDVLYAYVNLDPTYPPAEVMLQWYVIEPNGYGSWEHRAYWGANHIAWGADGTVSRKSMGALPSAGQWVRLEVPASAVGLEGKIVEGMAFTLWGGRAAWDSAGTINPDHDGDGLPDWWEVKYFGSLLQGPSDDYDADASSNLAEYLAGTDPNTISFLASYAEDHVNSNSVSGIIEVLGGFPARMAVLVNTTSCPAEAWVPYSSGFMVTLPLEGTNAVRVGLRGLPEDAEQTWDLTIITYDTTPPLIIITNPATMTTSVPMIQLQGYSPEPLTGLYYDITNSAGLGTNLQGYVTHQRFDTNLHGFTTNYFQCFDVGLAAGDNIITMRATDLAGNAAVLVTNFTLVSDGAAPLVGIGWPTNGAQLCGDSFTLYGWLDDPTATLTLSVTDATSTKTFTGLVERSGRFWFQNLPLSDGSNQLSLVAVDAWGNSTATNFSVAKSDLLLTIDDIDPFQLTLQCSLAVQGTISDSSYTVWVNGVPASVGQGVWTAANVPFDSDSTAIFAVTAYPPNHDLEPAFARHTLAEDDPPFRIFVERHEQRSSYFLFNHLDFFHNCDGHAGDWFDWVEQQLSEESGHNWTETNASPGWWKRCQYTDGQNLELSTNVCVGDVIWPASKWPNTPPATWIWNEGECIQPRFPENPPCTAMEQFESGVLRDRITTPVPISDPDGPYYGHFVSARQHLEYGRSAHSSVKIFTGGKAIPNRQGVLELYVWASEITDPWAGCVGGGGGNRLIPAAQTTVGDFGKPNSDYWLIAANVPAGVTKDATVRTPTRRYVASISGSAPGWINECVATIPTNRTRLKLGVGEEVYLRWNPWPQNFPTYTATAGSLRVWSTDGSTWLFTAPSNATPEVTVRATFPGGRFVEKRFSVVAPNGVTATIRGQADLFTPLPVVGAGMQLDVILQTTDVSFYRVEMMEPSAPATGTGYFANNPPQHGDHQGANDWHPVDYGNKVTEAFFDHAKSVTLAWPVPQGGVYTWPIPAVCRVGAADTRTNLLPGWTAQVHTMAADGTMTVQKLGRSVVRRPNEPRGQTN